MTRKIKISIPEPCHEKWSEMTPTEKGRFCSNCKKNVIDFTKSSDREILLAYSNSENLCGQFRVSQLDRTIIIPKEKKSIWMIAAASIIAFLGLGNYSVRAQQSIRTEQTDKKQSKESINVISKEETIFSGIVYDDKKIPLPGVSINIKNAKRGTQTNFDGNFSIKAKKGEVLVLSYIGFETIELKLDDISKFSIIMITSNVELSTGIVVIVRPQEED